MTEKIIILDFGSQVTQLIGRRLRELNVFCEIFPFDKVPVLDGTVKGVILSGSPCSVRDANAPQINLEGIIPFWEYVTAPSISHTGSEAKWKAPSPGNMAGPCLR